MIEAPEMLDPQDNILIGSDVGPRVATAFGAHG
jgi:hypothetical protein